jgi:hypothetical protein
MKPGLCVYCGEARELTRDHVPPRCLFSKPRPQNLITVPCCNNCNRGLSKHDEYFRIAIAAGIDKEKFPNEFADSVRAINSLIRPSSQGFARLLLQNYERDTSSLTFDMPRIEIVLYRIARGLFYHNKAERLPGTIAFVSRSVDSSLSINSNGRELIDRLEGNLITIGQGIFRYAFEPFEPPDPFGTVWLMRFYDHRTFFCVTASE